MKKRLAVLLVLCAATSVLGGVPGARGAAVRYRDLVFTSYASTKNLVYGQSVNSAGQLQQHLLDVHEPAGDVAPLRAAVVWVHGGFFIDGSKESYRGTWEQFVKAGFVTISINYRLRPELPRGAAAIITELAVPEAIDATEDAQHDAQAAVRWARANAARFRIDTNRIAIAGHSAGGITAQRVAYNDHDPGTSGNPGYSSRVRAAVSMAGASVPVLLANVGLGEPPMIEIHGVVDDIVPFPSGPPSCLTAAALLNVCELVIDPDQDHDTFGGDYARDFLYRQMIVPSTALPRVRVSVIGASSAVILPSP